MSVLKETTDLDRLVSSGLAYSEVKACLLPARLQLDGLKEALRAALARAESAEALVREAGMMLKKHERSGTGLDGTEVCAECRKPYLHAPTCDYAAIITRIAELETP